MATYLSFIEQVLHYLVREDAGPPAGPVGGPAAWRGSDLDDSWLVHLTPTEQAELRDGLAALAHDARPVEALTAADLPLPTLGPRIAAWRDELADGRGFLLVRGLPIDGADPAAIERMFWCLGQHLGRPGAQNGAGDLLGHVTDLSDDLSDPNGRIYRTNLNIRYHCDMADVVGLLCLRTAREGGLSRLVASTTVHDVLRQEQPALAQRLFQPFELDARNDGDATTPQHLPVQPCVYDGTRLRTFFHSDYFRSVDRHPDVTVDPADVATLDAWEAVAEREELRLDMALQPGDLQLVNNHLIAHARSGYVDHDDPAQRRHLLRLWLSLV